MPSPRPTSVNNPFKERKHAWLKYAGPMVLLVGLYVAVSVFAPENPERQNVRQLAHNLIRHQGSRFAIETDQIVNAQREAMKLKKKKKVVEGRVIEVRKVEEQRGYDDDQEDDEEEETFPKVSHAKFPTWLHEYYEDLEWRAPTLGKKRLTREILDTSRKLGCTNMVHNQLEDKGNFNYLYDFISHEMDPSDSQVRQAGALWGVTLCFQAEPTSPTLQKSVERGLQFFLKNSISGPAANSILVNYPGDDASQTGTNGLIGLSLVDYLRTVKDNNLEVENVDELREKLVGIINHLKYTQKESSHFAQQFDLESHKRSKTSSSYFDGEAMLCLTKAAIYLDGFSDLVPLIEDSVFKLAKSYTVDAWRTDEHDSDETKGFYQWSSMFMTEYYHAGFRNHELAGDYVITLAHWILYTHEILRRPKNTGYAFEGIISAYDIAKERKHFEALQDLEYAIDEGLFKLTSWQVGGPLAKENPFLRENPTTETIAVGGVMNAKNEPALRIDTTQHQMHAVVMAMSSVYTSISSVA